MNSIYYVYIYLDPRKPGNFIYGENGEYKFDYEPFYVGKGVRNRMIKHLESKDLELNKTTIKSKKIKNILDIGLKPIIIKYEDNLEEEYAYELEKTIVSIIGRINSKTGPLTNLTDGGIGARGVKQSKETIEKRFVNRKGEKHHYFGKTRDLETKDKISKTLSGKPLSTETKQKLSNKLKGKPQGPKQKRPILQFDLNGNLLNEFNSISQASKITGIKRSAITDNCLKNKPYKGFIWKFKN